MREATASAAPSSHATFKQATRAEPANVAAYDDLGNAYIELKKFDEAVAAYREAVRLEPKNAGAHNGLGRALEKSGRIEESVGPFREALRLSPANGNFRIGASKGKPEYTKQEYSVGDLVIVNYGGEECGATVIEIVTRQTETLYRAEFKCRNTSNTGTFAPSRIRRC